LAILSEERLEDRVVTGEVRGGEGSTNLPHQLAQTNFVTVPGQGSVEERPVKHLDKPRIVRDHAQDGKLFFNNPEVIVDV
jgi:hypothetical protein